MSQELLTQDIVELLQDCDDLELLYLIQSLLNQSNP